MSSPTTNAWGKSFAACWGASWGSDTPAPLYVPPPADRFAYTMRVVGRFAADPTIARIAQRRVLIRRK